MKQEREPQREVVRHKPEEETGEQREETAESARQSPSPLARPAARKEGQFCPSGTLGNAWSHQ